MAGVVVLRPVLAGVMERVVVLTVGLRVCARYGLNCGEAGKRVRYIQVNLWRDDEVFGTN